MVEELKRTWSENKFLMIVCGVIATGLLTWGVWVTKDPGGSPLDRKVALADILGLKLGTITNAYWYLGDGKYI